MNGPTRGARPRTISISRSNPQILRGPLTTIFHIFCFLNNYLRLSGSGRRAWPRSRHRGDERPGRARIPHGRGTRPGSMTCEVCPAPASRALPGGRQAAPAPRSSADHPCAVVGPMRSPYPEGGPQSARPQGARHLTGPPARPLLAGRGESRRTGRPRWVGRERLPVFGWIVYSRAMSTGGPGPGTCLSPGAAPAGFRPNPRCQRPREGIHTCHAGICMRSRWSRRSRC